MLLKPTSWIVGLLAATALGGCGDDSSSSSNKDSGVVSDSGTAGTGSTAGTGGGDSGTAKSLCEKYGGKSVVHDAITMNVVGKIAGDCKINKFFTTLSSTRLTHLSECLAIQAEELFGCEGVKYEGSSYGGAPCRSMTAAHVGLNIDTGDFNALLSDVAAGLTDKGVEAADITTAATALTGLKSMIVTKSPDSTDPSMSICTDDDGGAADGG